MKKQLKNKTLIFLNSMLAITLIISFVFAMIIKLKPTINLYPTTTNNDIVTYLFILAGMCLLGYIIEILAIYGINASLGKHGFKISQGVDNEKDNEPKKSS